MPFAQLMAVLPLRDVACSLRVPSNPNGLKYNKDENETVIAHRSDCGLFLFRQKKGVRQWMSNSKLIELSYYDPSAQVRLSAYADTLVLDHDQNGSIISAIRFGGYPEMVRAMADAIYGGATIEAAQNDTTRMLQSSLKSYQRQITHDGIYAVATLMAADTVQEDDRSGKHEKDEDTNLVDTEQMELQPRRCYIFCPARDQKRLFEELDHKTAAPLIPEFQDYVLSSLRQRGDLRQLEVISLKERIDAWVLDLKPQDQNVVEVLERGLQSGDIQIPGAVPNMPDGFENVENVTGYMREEYKLTEADRNASFIFLLDGFNEIPTTTMQIRCLRDILDISDKKYPEAAIILSNRDPLDTYMDLLEYSHMKKAELVLKGYVSESSSTQLTSLNIAINGGLAMGHYWKGRLLLEQAKQDHDRCNDYKDAAIASFCATNVTERFDHLPENADEDAAPQLSPPQWLSAIELLRYPDRAVFRVDRRMVFQTIYQKLTQQVEEVQSDNIQIHNERYRLTKKDVRSNLERCLDMVKAQFPDKEPLIQKMIRSIR